MINGKEYSNLYIELNNPTQFDGSAWSHGLLEHITNAYTDGGIEEFFERAGADMVVATHDISIDDSSNRFFSLGAKVARDGGRGTRVFWVEIHGYRAYWVGNITTGGMNVLRMLALALYNLPLS